MIKRFALYLLLLLILAACDLPLVGDQALEDGSPNAQDSPSRYDGEALVPMTELTETVDCTWFAAPDGDDDSEGIESQPWQTIQYAVDKAGPGETICFREGVFPLEDPVHLTQSGSTESPIVLIAYPGELPILDGGGEAGSLLIVDQGTSNLRISGFALQNFTDWGLDLEGSNSNIQLDHLSVEGGEAGVHFTYGGDELAPPEGGPVDHITLEDSLIYNSEYTAVDCTPGPCDHMIFRKLEVFGSGVADEESFGADGIAVSRGYPILIEDCFIHDNGGDGIDLNSRDRQGYATGVLVRRNKVVRNNQNGIKLWAGGRIENNLVWGQGNSALWLGTFHGELQVVNNTVAFNMWDPAYSGRNWAISVGYPEEIIPLPLVDLLMVNNIIAYNTGPDVGDPTGVYLGPGIRLTEHHNLYFSRVDGEITAAFLDREFTRHELVEGAWVDHTGQGQYDLAEDPQFLAGWPSVDLRLQPLSPAIDAGDNDSCPADDYYGHLRPRDNGLRADTGCDIGAIEFGSERGMDRSGSSALHDVQTWFYYIDVDLEGETLERIIESRYDMVVIDYVTSEESNTDFPLDGVIGRMHSSGHPKVVIAYIDIGQAEEYRTYWEPGWGVGDPHWILGQDPDGWEGNYPVAYWSDEYRNIWLGEGGYLQGILDAGFDGVYLDWVEAYSDANVIARANELGVDPIDEMILWVEDIAAYTRAQAPDFVVIAQNAAELAKSDRYVGIIDAIAQEQVWFDGGADNNPPGDCPLPATEDDVGSSAYYASLSPQCKRQFNQFPEGTLSMSTAEYLQDLMVAQVKGLIVFTVDYATDPENVGAIYRNARKLGFVPFVGNRALDQYIEPVR